MRIIQAFTIIALSSLPGPALAQDFLAPLQDMVDELTAKPPAQRPRAAPADPEPDAPDASVPVPRPRPPSLPDVPVVEAPDAPLTPAPEAGAPAAAEPAEAEETAEPPADQAEEAPTGETEPEEPPAPGEPAVPAESAEAEAPAEPEPERVYQVACPAIISGLVEAELAPPLSEGVCGEQSPLTVTAVMSRGRMVPLSSPITTNCQLASQLPGWVEAVDGYAQSVLESPLAGVTTGTSYMCRPRVSTESQFTSEHGFANAVDVVGFTLEDGRTIGVTENWAPAEEPAGRLLRLAHDAACGSFMTVLGPEANSEHHDHLHLDMGCHGQSCLARICQ